MPTLADFVGDWHLRRRIDDRLAARPGGFEGTARLSPEGAGLRYREEGALTIGGGPAFPAHRDHLWRADGDGVAVLFADGRPFHRFRPQGRAPGSDHPCGPDLYRVVYDFTRWPAWTAEWTVTGPAKDYVMLSQFVPRNLRGAIR